MTITANDVRVALSPDEPDYDAIARRLGDQAADPIAEVAGGADFRSAAKAASLAGYLAPAAAQRVLAGAAEHPHYLVRVAVAGALARVPTSTVTQIAPHLLSDARPEVRYWAIRSVQRTRATALRDEVARIAREDGVDHVRSLAADVAAQFG